MQDLTFQDHVIVKIAKFLSIKQIVSLMLVNKQFNKALLSPEIWQSLLETYFGVQQHIRRLTEFRSKTNKLAILITDLLSSIENRIGVDISQKSQNVTGQIPPSGQIPKQGMSPSLQYNNSGKFYEMITQVSFKKLYGNQLTKPYFFFGGFKAYNSLFLFELHNESNHSAYHQNTMKYCFCKIIPGDSKVYVDISNKLGLGRECLYTHLQEDNEQYIYVMNKTLKAFLDERVVKRELSQQIQGQYFYYDILDSFVNPGSDTTTEGIRIRVAVKFCPWKSAIGDQHMFIYQIRISDGGVGANKFVLQTREWFITHDGITEHVSGPGVIGLYPEVSQGCPDFTYESCTYIPGWNGVMYGSFTFRNTSNNQNVKALIQPFHLRLTNQEAIITFDQQNQPQIVIDGAAQIM